MNEWDDNRLSLPPWAARSSGELLYLTNRAALHICLERKKQKLLPPFRLWIHTCLANMHLKTHTNTLPPAKQCRQGLKHSGRFFWNPKICFSFRNEVQKNTLLTIPETFFFLSCFLYIFYKEYKFCLGRNVTLVLVKQENQDVDALQLNQTPEANDNKGHSEWTQPEQESMKLAGRH